MSQYYCQFCDTYQCNDTSPMHRVKSHDNKEGSYDVCEECYIQYQKETKEYLDSMGIPGVVRSEE